MWDGVFGAEDIQEIIRQILLYNKKFAAHNPRKGLLYRLTTMQSDAHETLVERFDEMNEMLNEKVLNEELGDKARTHMNKLQRMFDVYSRRQREVGSVVLLSL